MSRRRLRGAADQIYFGDVAVGTNLVGVALGFLVAVAVGISIKTEAN